MVRTIAPLVYYDRVDNAHIKIGTGSWQVWLSNTQSFRYESFWGSFTAYKEQQGQDVIWIAYRRIKEELRRDQLGTSHELTVEKLVDTAKKLKANNTAPWAWERQTETIVEPYSSEVEAILKPKPIERNAIRQWCIFYTAPDGRVEFVGACWEKEQALNRIQNLNKLAHSSDAIGGLSDGTLGRYEMREEFVLPIDYTHNRSETNGLDSQTTTKEVELIHQVAELRRQLSELQKQVEQERVLNAKENGSVKFLWN